MRIVLCRSLLLAVTIACGCGKSTGPGAAAIAATAAFVDVTVISMTNDQALAHQTVLVDGIKIVAIGPVSSTPVPRRRPGSTARASGSCPGSPRGTITLDGDGLPKSIELKAGSATLEITRR